MPSIVAKIVGDASHFDKTVSGVNGKLKGLKKAIGVLGFGLSAKAALDFSLQLIRQGSHLTDVADKLGITTKYLQEFNYAAQQEGVAATAAEMGLQRFTRRLAEARENTGELLKVIRKYNIQLTDSSGGARTAGAVLEDLSRIIQNTEDPAERLRIAFKAFDSEGAALVNVLRKGPDAMRAWIKEANNIGAVVSDEQLRRMDKYSDKIDKVTSAFKGLATTALGKGIEGNELVTKLPTNFVIKSLSERGAEKALREEAEKRIRENETVASFGWSERVQTEAGGYIKMSERIKQVTEELRQEKINLYKATVAAAKAAEEHTKALAATKAEEERLLKKDTGNKILGWMVAGNKALAKLNEERLRGQHLNQLDERRRDLLQQQSAALETQKRLQADLSAYRNRFTTPTFEDYANGVGGSESKRLANRLMQARSRVKMLRARGYTSENGESYGPPSEVLSYAENRLSDLENRFEQRTGLDLNPQEQAFKTALGETEKELKNITTQIKKL